MRTFQLLVIMLATFLWPAILRPTAIMRNFMPCFRRIACTGNQPRSQICKRQTLPLHQTRSVVQVYTSFAVQCITASGTFRARSTCIQGASCWPQGHAQQLCRSWCKTKACAAGSKRAGKRFLEGILP